MDNNKLILFSNIKGGVGKTTLTECFAHYLVMKGEPVVVVDADIQQTLAHDVKTDKELLPDTPQPWQCLTLDTLDPEQAVKIIEQLKQVPGWVLVDCPGNLQDPSLVSLFKAADVIVTPIAFDRKSLDGTSTFVQVLIRLKVGAKIVFVPNRIVTTENNAEYQARRNEAKQVLSQFGKITARIKQSVIFNRLNTLKPLDRYQYNTVEHACDDIMNVVNGEQ